MKRRRSCRRMFVPGYAALQMRCRSPSVVLALACCFRLCWCNLILVAQFESFLDPFLILLAVPTGLIGVLLLLFASGTTLNVMSLMGIVMMVGIVVSNSILIVEFTRRLCQEGKPLRQAVTIACRVRLRPVLMTALAMIIGMLPMALGLGEGGEQNAPLGRGVIGGLMVATFATLLFVPVVFSLLHRSSPSNSKPEETNSSQGLAATAPAT